MPIQRTPPSRLPRQTRRYAAATAVLALGVFVFYVAVYRANGYRLPVGFDAAWYVWRGDFVAQHGIGPLGTAQRPGAALLAAQLHAVTGLSQLRLDVVLPPVMVAVFALAVGAFAAAGLGGGAMAWGVSIAVAGTFLGVTRLVGENLATLITVALVVAALPPMIRRATGGRGMVGAVALLVAAGLAHWLFLAVFVAVLGVAAALAWPSSRRAMAAGVPGWRTESGTIAGAAGIAAGAMLVLIAAVLRAPFDTIQAREDPSRFGQKLRSDLRRAYLPWTVPVAAFGAVRLGLDERERRSPARRMALRLLVAWAGVAAAGVLYGIVTKGLPPHRFFELLLAVPVALSLAAAVLAAATWAGRRAGRPLAWAVAAAGVVVIAIPGWSAWYRHNPGEWIQPTALRQAAAAAEYVRGLPAGTPVVFLVSPTGQAGVLSTALNERIIRAAMPPDVQADVYLFPGRAADLLAGRRTITGNPAQNDATLPYWQALQPVLGRDPPVLILRSLARTEYDAAIASGATAPVPGVAILRGPPPATPLRLGPVPVAAPSLRSAVLWGAAVLALLFAIGGGWTALLLGRGASPAVAIALAPAAGVAAIMLAAVLPARAGVGLGGAAGVVLFVVVALAGWALAWWDRRASQRPAASAPAPATVP